MQTGRKTKYSPQMQTALCAWLLRREADPSRIEKLQQQLTTLRERKMNNELAIARIENAYEEGRYSQEKMEEKVMERNTENAQIEGQMQDIEDKLSLISAKEIEIAKLKEASEQVKHRLKTMTGDRRRSSAKSSWIASRCAGARCTIAGRYQEMSSSVSTQTSSRGR